MTIDPKIKVIILIVLGVFILLFLVFIYFYLNIPKPEVPPETQTKALTSEEEIELQKEVAEIIKTNDFNKCQEIQNDLYRKVCINNIALNLAEEKQDISYCQKLDDKLVSIIGCERQTLLKKSQYKEDINICNETKNSGIQKECKEKFWQVFSLREKDIKLCDNITTEQEKNVCYDNYLFKEEFIKSESTFNCEKFYDSQVKLDCKNYKNNKCDGPESALFLNYCLYQY